MRSLRTDYERRWPLETSVGEVFGAVTLALVRFDYFSGFPSVWPYRLATGRHHEGGPTHTPEDPPLPQENLSLGPGSVAEPSRYPTCEEIRPA